MSSQGKENKTKLNIRTLLDLQVHKEYQNEEKTAVIIGSPLHELLEEKWVSLKSLNKLLDELNPDEISEDVHDFIMKTFKPKRWGWAKDISPLVWNFWNQLLEALEE